MRQMREALLDAGLVDPEQFKRRETIQKEQLRKMRRKRFLASRKRLEDLTDDIPSEAN